MIQGSTVRNLTAKLVAAGAPRAELLPVVYEHGIGGHLTFQYECQGKTVGEVTRIYGAEQLLSEVAESIRLLGVPTAPALYETWKMEDWLVERLRA